MSESREIQRALRTLSLCSGLAPDALAALERASTLQQLARGEALPRCAASSMHVHGICDGFVRTERLAPDGTRRLVEVHGAGDAIGLGAFLQRSPAALDLRAQEPATIVLILGSSFDHELDTSPELRRNAARVLASEYALAREQLEVQRFRSAEAALAFRVVRLVSRHGQPDPCGGHVLPFRLSHEDLGSAIGIAAERVTRILRAWKRWAWLDVGHGPIVVRNLRALEARCRRPAAHAIAIAPPAPPELALAT